MLTSDKLFKEMILNDNKNDYCTERAYFLDREKIIYAFESLRKIIFPDYYKLLKENISLENYIFELKENVTNILNNQIALVLPENNSNKSEEITEKANVITENFLSRIPQIKKMLLQDVNATFNNDPAAECKSQIIFSYPGITAITFYRLANELRNLNVPLIPRIVSEYAHSLTGIDIHPGAKIGSSFCIDHGTGIVIGETTIIGNNVKIYQGVTLGALSIKNRESTINKKRHPTIENNVTLYAGCTILGGETVIGENSVIGGSAFIVKSIPKNTIVSIELPKLKFKEQN